MRVLQCLFRRLFVGRESGEHFGPDRLVLLLQGVVLGLGVRFRRRRVSRHIPFSTAAFRALAVGQRALRVLKLLLRGFVRAAKPAWTASSAAARSEASRHNSVNSRRGASGENNSVIAGLLRYSSRSA